MASVTHATCAIPHQGGKRSAGCMSALLRMVLTDFASPQRSQTLLHDLYFFVARILPEGLLCFDLSLAPSLTVPMAIGGGVFCYVRRIVGPVRVQRATQVVPLESTGKWIQRFKVAFVEVFATDFARPAVVVVQLGHIVEARK